MNVVAPITVAWQGVVDSVNAGAKEFETFDELDEAIERAREVNDAAESLQNSQYSGSNPKAHITIHPGAYEYGSSVEESTDLDDVYITILPGAKVTDSLSTLSESTTTNVADLNSFARTAFFSEKEDTFIFDSTVEFRAEVIFQENQFPVKSVQGGEALLVDSTFGDITVSHEQTGGASDNTNENTFLNQIQVDEFGHLQDAQFGTVQSGVGLEDDGSEVLPLARRVNFASNLSVIDDEDGTATVTIPGTEDFQISELQNLFPFGEPLSKTSGTSGVEAKLGVSVGNFSKNDLFRNDTETEKGVIASGGVIEGELNPQIESTDLHDAQIFARASTGTLKLVVNGSNLITMNLEATESAIARDSTSGNSTLSVSSSSPLLYPNRDVFERATQRTGSWEIGTEDLSLGLNKIQIVHEIDESVFGETQELLYFLEDTDFQVNVSNGSFSLVETKGPIKRLSGIAYNTGADVEYSVVVENPYRNVYSSKDEAIDFLVSDGVDLVPQEVPELQSGQDETAQINFTKERDVLSKRLILDSPQAQFRIEDPIEGQKTSSVASGLDLLIDNTSNLSTETTHVFETEKYRAPPNKNFDTVIQTGEYDSSNSIRDDGNPAYNNQLQVTGGKLVYPSTDYSQAQNGTVENPDYSSATTGVRTYYGIFINDTSVSNFVLRVKGSGSILSPGSLSTGNQGAAIEIKAPTQTGWLDVNNFFTVGNLQDGDGAYQPTNAKNPKKTIGPESEIGLTIGEKDTIDSFNRLYYRITAPEDWSGEITKMDITWGLS
jgi:hypothetical protein